MLNLRQIEAFKAVIETGTVSRAARRLCISQPAVSKLIQNLELSTGLDLFERTPGKIVPTPDALLLFEEVERVFKGLSSLQNFVADIRSLHHTNLGIGVMPALSTGFIQDIVAEFDRRYSLTRVAIHARSTLKIVELLLSGNIDVGVSSHPVEDPELEQISLDSRPLVCVMPPDHPLSELETLEPSDLEGQRYIAFAPGSDQGTRIDAVFSAAGVRPIVTVEAPMAPTICAMVARGSGVAILNPLYLGAFANMVVCRPFSPKLISDVRILLPRYRPRSRATDAFVEIARTYIEGLPPHL